MNKITPLIAVLAIASVASAATPGSVTQGNVTVSWTANIAPNGMDRYIVTLTGSNLIQAYDGSFTGEAINQQLVPGPGWIYPPFPPYSGFDLGNDSHYLPDPAKVLPVASSGMELSTSLAWAFGVPDIYQTAIMPLAQIVVPTGSSFVASGTIAIGGQPNPFNVPIPEPATMGLLGMGSFALLRRRKRSQSIQGV